GGGRAVHRRTGGRARVPARRAAHGGRLCTRPLHDSGGRAAISKRGLWTLPGGWNDRVYGATRRSGEAARVSDRTGRDRGSVSTTRGGAGRGGGGARRWAGRDAAGGLCSNED